MGKKCCCNSQRLTIAKSFIPPPNTVTIINQMDETFSLDQTDFNYSLYQTFPTSNGCRLLEWTFQIRFPVILENFKAIKFDVPNAIPLSRLPKAPILLGLTVGSGTVVSFETTLGVNLPLSFSFNTDMSDNLCLYGTLPKGLTLDFTPLTVLNIWGHIEYTI